MGHSEQINSARGNMRGDILDALFDPLDDFLDDSCAAVEKATYAYIGAVSRTGIWKLKRAHRKSNKEVIDSPGFLNWKANIPKDACYSCKHRLEGTHIAQARTDILSYWQGLCLDCMDISKTQTGDFDGDYWMYNDLEKWSKNCRIKHLRNTWYFSFMGRQEIMNSFQREEQERKKAARRR